MKKPVKIIFSVVLSVAMVLSLALTAYGASSLTSDFAVTVERERYLMRMATYILDGI